MCLLPASVAYHAEKTAVAHILGSQRIEPILPVLIQIRSEYPERA